MKAHAECWHIQPYSRILVSLPDGARVLVLVPAGKKYVAEKDVLKAGEVVVDYRYGG